MYRVGKALGAFWLGRDTGREPASCAGGRENSLALQAPSVTRLCLGTFVIGVASLLRLQWTHLCLGFMVTG